MLRLFHMISFQPWGEIMRLWGISSTAKFILICVLVSVVTKVAIKMWPYYVDEIIVALVCGVFLLAFIRFFVFKFLLKNPRAKIQRWVEKFRKISLKRRIVIWATCSWILAVLGFVYSFEPFGSYMRDDDWAVVWKIVFIPPIIGIFIHFTYDKLIK